MALDDGTVQVWDVSWPHLLDVVRSATTACLPVNKRRFLLGEQDKDANDGYEKCEKDNKRR